MASIELKIIRNSEEITIVIIKREGDEVFMLEMKNWLKMGEHLIDEFKVSRKDHFSIQDC